MKLRQGRNRLAQISVVAFMGIGLLAGGCGPSYRELRIQGQELMLKGSFGAARSFLRQAEERRPRRVDNLHDLGACSIMLARAKFKQMNQAAALREVDSAIAFFSQAIDVYPGHQASLEGKTIALKLKGQFDEALKHAQWAADFVGPSARQYLFLAKEYEERGDEDGSFLRYRQAIAVEPRNAEAHRAFARFLLKKDNNEAAVFHLQAAYRLDPTHPWVIDELVSRSALPPLASTDAQTP